MSQGQEGKWDCNAFLIQFYPTALEKGTAATQKKKKKLDFSTFLLQPCLKNK